jgi:hypothetical protein
MIVIWWPMCNPIVWVVCPPIFDHFKCGSLVSVDGVKVKSDDRGKTVADRYKLREKIIRPYLEVLM